MKLYSLNNSFSSGHIDNLPTSKSGFTYLAILFFVAILGVALAAIGTYWHIEKIREKELELIYLGHQFRNAIESYYLRSPGTVKNYPMTFDDLLRDKRFIGIQRHLRKIYADPMTGRTEWGIVRAPDGGIMGIYSKSEDKPLKIGNFARLDRNINGKSHYSDWKFIYNPPL